MIKDDEVNPNDILEDATKLVLAIDKVARKIDVPELKTATTNISAEKQKILQRQFNNNEKS